MKDKSPEKKMSKYIYVNNGLKSNLKRGDSKSKIKVWISLWLKQLNTSY